VFVKPAVRTVVAEVIDPDSFDRIPAEGKEVTDSPYWQTMISRGDVVIVEAPALESGAPSAVKPLCVGFLVRDHL
jgi:hypothetical protein